MHSAIESDCEEPKTYNMMLKRPVEERKKWLAGVAKELQDFKRREVWRKIKKRDVLTRKSLIGPKWVIKLKRNGVF